MKTTTTYGREEFLRNDLISDLGRLNSHVQSYYTAARQRDVEKMGEYAELIGIHIQHQQRLVKRAEALT